MTIYVQDRQNDTKCKIIFCILYHLIKHLYSLNLYRVDSFELMVHIGKLIKKQLELKKLSVAEFAQKINTNRNNVYDIFKRTSIDTELLYKISIILNFDFFKELNPLEDIKEDEKLLNAEWLTIQFEKLNKKIDTIIANKNT